MTEKPFVVACILAYDEERTIGGVVVRARARERPLKRRV